MRFLEMILSNINTFELDIIFKLIVAFFIGGSIGYTRSMSGKPAGIRTQILLCVGSTLLTAISIHLKDIYYSPNADPARLMAQIVTGIGFLGGGVILKSDKKIVGVTTAAMVWVTAAIGIAVGSGFYLVSGVMLIIVWLLEPIAYFQFKVGLKSKPYILTVKTKYLNQTIMEIHNIDIKRKGQEEDNGSTTLYLLSSFQKNSLLEVALTKKRIPYKIKKFNSQDFQ